jgi:phage protein U
MLFQLGNIIFQGLLGPSTFNVDSLEAVYAEHQLLSGKSRLQPTGSMLEEIQMEIKFHAEFCKPDKQIDAIRQSIASKTIMPLLLGNGKFVNDYVVISAPYVIDEMLPDGTTKAATLTLTIREFVSYNKLEQKQNEAKKAAFAVGDKSPVVRRYPQAEVDSKAIARNITSTKQQASKINDLVGEYENNVSKRAVLAKKIQDTCKKVNSQVDSVNAQLNEARELQNKFTGIKGAVSSVKTAAAGISNLYPFDNVTDLLTANGYLQNATGTLGSVFAPLASLVATRQPVI